MSVAILHKRLNRLFFVVIGLLLSDITTASSRGLEITYKQSESANAADAGNMQLYSNSFALVVGIDDYRAGWPRLSKAVSDADIVAVALEEKGFSVIRKHNLAGRDLELAFEDFFLDQGADPEARLFVWYAGHGHTLEGEGFLVPADGALPSNRKQFLRRAISLRRFSEFVRLAESKHVFTIFDSCFAGTIFNVARSAPPPAITRVTARPVRQFLSSGDAGQTVSDDGTFAALFVDAIRGERRADLNQDGYLTAGELGSFLTNKISNYTNNKQVPRFGKLRDPKFDQGDFVFLASLSPIRPQVQQAQPSAPLAKAFSLDDLSSNQQAWQDYQSRLLVAVDTTQAFDKQNQGDKPLLISAWQRLLTSFSEDNPLTSDDNDIRARIEARLKRLRTPAKPLTSDMKPIVRISPKYPVMAAREGLTGWVIAEFSVNQIGGVEAIKILSNCASNQGSSKTCSNSPSTVFDREVKRALTKFKYRPRIVNGQPVVATGIKLQLDFNLN